MSAVHRHSHAYHARFLPSGVESSDAGVCKGWGQEEGVERCRVGEKWGPGGIKKTQGGEGREGSRVCIGGGG